MIIKDAKVFCEGHLFLQKDIRIEKDIITEIADTLVVTEQEAVVDAKGLMVLPGLIDIHLHGACMQDVSDASANAIKKIAEYEALQGVLAICPTTMTVSEKQLGEIADSFWDFINNGQTDKMAAVLGMRLEGPFLSEKKAGAQSNQWLKLPSLALIEALQKRSNHQVRIIDIAPEIEGAEAFIKQAREKYVISMAHTGVDYEQAKKAFQCGISHVTHLYNAMNGIHHRNPGPIVAAREKGATVELICDGIHIHPAMMRLSFDLFDEDKIILISDSMRACGMPDGIYTLGGQEVVVKEKKATLRKASDTIAGSVTNLYECMCQAIKCGVEPEKAIAAATLNPAKVLKIEDKYGVIKEKAYANLLVVDETYHIKNIICRGNLLK